MGTLLGYIVIAGSIGMVVSPMKSTLVKNIGYQSLIGPFILSWPVLAVLTLLWEVVCGIL